MAEPGTAAIPPGQVEGVSSVYKPPKAAYVVIALIVVAILIYIFFFRKSKGSMYDPVTADLPIPGSFIPSDNILQFGNSQMNYNRYSSNRFGGL